MKTFATIQEAWNYSVANGGFVYTDGTQGFWVGTMDGIAEATRLGLKLV